MQLQHLHPFSETPISTNPNPNHATSSKLFSTYSASSTTTIYSNLTITLMSWFDGSLISILSLGHAFWLIVMQGMASLCARCHPALYSGTRSPRSAAHRLSPHNAIRPVHVVQCRVGILVDMLVGQWHQNIPIYAAHCHAIRVPGIAAVLAGPLTDPRSRVHAGAKHPSPFTCAMCFQGGLHREGSIRALFSWQT